ncbi:hypothetical protein [Amycolatopsis speibonae]|uniref:Fe/B12 periplasmic-binding domain-containing protein n=1 Tax=Amycolatopsis speibonae TaxID=1450224 RepID=A0ABV7P644_9PSEU
MRIVSLLPAATDFVATLGLLGSLTGRTHECDWPPGALDDVPVVTSSAIDHDVLSSREISAAVGGEHRGSGLYSLDADLLSAARPDVILTQGSRFEADDLGVALHRPHGAGRPRTGGR